MLGKTIEDFEYKKCKVLINDVSELAKEDSYLFVYVLYKGDDKWAALNIGDFDLMEEELEKESAENMAKNYIDFIEFEYSFDYLMETAFTDDDPLMSDGVEWDLIREPRENFLEELEKLNKLSKRS